MTIDPIAAYSSSLPSAATTASQKASMDYDTFLQLLITQMKNQDPLQPMESSEYVAQLATFSNVEQSILTNNKLDALLSATMLSQAGSIIGKTITSADGKVSGVVEAVRFVTGGAIAILADGQEVPLSDGTKLSQKDAEEA
jgi:flagellar basal-body rod modification protein FlgD